MDDEKLVDLILDMAQNYNKLPTLDAITSAAECQRSRAVAARKVAAQKIAKNQLEANLDLPPELENRHRALVREWMAFAASQLDKILEQAVDDNVDQLTANEQAAVEARYRANSLTERVADLEELVGNLEQEAVRLNKRLVREANAAVRWKALALDRKTILDQFVASGGAKH